MIPLPPRSLARCWLVSITIATLCVACAPEAPPPTSPAAVLRANAVPRAALLEAIAVQERASEELLARPGVVGTATGLDRAGRPVVRVYTDGSGVALVPRVLEGVPVEVEIAGPFLPFALDDRHRPVPIGVSFGNANECLPGTLGAMLERGGQRYALSANHVLARQNQAAIGESVVQPSRPDASAACEPSPPPTIVGQLAEFEPLRFDGTANVMDAAIARLTEGAVCGTPPEYYGTPGAPIAPDAGLPVQKVGRTTGLTRGTITGINAKVVIFYPGGKAKFTGQMMTSKAFGGFGDSGALVVTDDGARNAVGMVFAGGSNGTAVVSPIAPILARFGATLCGR